MMTLPRATMAKLGRARRQPFDNATLEIARGIVRDVRDGGESTLRTHAERLGDIGAGAPLVIDRAALLRARDGIDPETLAVLERTAARIEAFARAQLACLNALEVQVPGGKAGHRVVPLARAGCYAPGGRYPLPSSLLMTAVSARAAGVGEVWAASPRPTTVMLAAAAVAGVEGLLTVGGAQAIAAMAYGIGGVPACDIIVGPGNRYVTAAKHVVSTDVAIDMLAGVSELVVLTNDSGDAALIAADLLAQAEHDPDASAILITTDARLADRVDEELERQLADLPTAETARAALRGSFAVVVADLEEAIEACERIAPEHLHIHVEDPRSLSQRLSSCGSLFLGATSAEVLGDYGAGPNHVLPTGGTARFTAGLSVMTFLRCRTWLEMDQTAGDSQLLQDAAALARLEGLEAHARSADARRPRPSSGPSALR